jgi:Heavy metal binding domain
MNEKTSASGETHSSGADVHLPSASNGVGAGSPGGGGQPPGPDRGGGGLVMVARLGLLLAAMVAFGAAITLARAHDRNGSQAERMSTERYVCPMHPEVLSRLPGECPICRMALERVSGIDKHAAAMAKDGVVGVVQQRVVSQTIRAPAWGGAHGLLTTVLYKDDLVGLAAGQKASFFTTATPGTPIPIRRTDEAPTPWDAETVQVTFRFERAAPANSDLGWLEIAPQPRALLVVPTSAVLYSGAGAYVLVAPAGGSTFARRTVEVGRILDSGYGAGLVDDRYGAIVVRAGLRAGERIIIEDTFFMDAERRLQAAQGNAPEVTL